MQMLQEGRPWESVPQTGTSCSSQEVKEAYIAVLHVNEENREACGSVDIQVSNPR